MKPKVKARDVQNKSISFRFISTQNCNFLQFEILSKSKQFLFVMRSKPNRERLGSFNVTNIRYTRAALNIPSGNLPSSQEFLMEDDNSDE